MTHTLALVQMDHAHTGNSQTDAINPRQLLEAYGTILALQLKLEAGSRQLARLCETPHSPTAVQVERGTERLVDKAISDRSRRTTILPARLFADPAWDVLLALYLAELRQHRVSLSNLCIASHVPSTTGLRWIGTLEAEGLVVRDADPLDRRRYYIRLTDAGSKAMKAYFSTSLDTEPQRCLG